MLYRVLRVATRTPYRAALVVTVMTLPMVAMRAPSAPPQPSFQIIGNTVGVAELDSSSLRAVFRGERSAWPSSKPVTIILPSARAEFAESLSRLLFRTSPGGMQRYWLALVFQGRATPPVFLDSADEMIAYVRRTPGAIAVVPTSPADLQIRDLVVRIR
ncbi:MAG: hypothetical protein RLZZ621_1724 [Gemmatimonadota bacterium]